MNSRVTTTTSLETSNLTLPEVIAWIEARLHEGATEVRLLCADPDLSPGHYDGQPVSATGIRHRSFRQWVDLAQRLRMRLSTPRALAKDRLELCMTRLADAPPWQRSPAGDVTEKYGVAGGYQRVSKLEDPDFVLDMSDALQRIDLPDAARVLDLGVNNGDSLALLRARLPKAQAKALRFVGLDHCHSAIEAARARFPDAEFIRCDLAQLPELSLPRFDLVMSIATFQSPSVDDRTLLQHIIRERLTPNGAIIVGVPNCSYLDGEVLDGATMRNFTQPELSLLVKNVGFYRRYLNQHRRKVFVTGKRTVLVTGVALERGSR